MWACMTQNGMAPESKAVGFADHALMPQRLRPVAASPAGMPRGWRYLEPVRLRLLFEVALMKPGYRTWPPGIGCCYLLLQGGRPSCV